MREEINFYYDQFELNEPNFNKLDPTGNTNTVWSLIRDGEGLKSLLKQASEDQKEEDLEKMMKLIPFMGCNVSFTTTYSVLNFILLELLALSKRLIPTKQSSTQFKSQVKRESKQTRFVEL